MNIISFFLQSLDENNTLVKMYEQKFQIKKFSVVFNACAVDILQKIMTNVNYMKSKNHWYR